MADQTSDQTAKLAELDKLTTELADRLGKLTESEVETSGQIDSLCNELKDVVSKAKDFFQQQPLINGERANLSRLEKEHLQNIENFENVITILNESLDAMSDPNDVIAKFKGIAISFKKLCSSSAILDATFYANILKYNNELIRLLEQAMDPAAKPSKGINLFGMFSKKLQGKNKILEDIKNICKRLNERDLPLPIDLNELITNLRKESVVVDPSTHDFLTKDQKTGFQSIDLSEVLKEADSLFRALPEAIQKAAKTKKTPPSSQPPQP